MAVSYRRTLIRRRVLVTLTNDIVFGGVLWAQRGPLLVLRDVTLYDAGHPPTPMDGEVVIERPRVAYIQTVSPTTEVR